MITLEGNLHPEKNITKIVLKIFVIFIIYKEFTYKDD